MEDFVHPPRTLMEVFKGLPEGTLVQLIENELIMSPVPNDIHQKTLGEIVTPLYNLAEQNKLGKVRSALYDIYLDDDNAFQPDILFVSNENIDIIKEDGIHGTPDLIIEILSPGTAKYDKNKKKEVYERCGVKEYWIVDPADKTVTGYCLENKKFIMMDESNAVIHSRLLQANFSF